MQDREEVEGRGGEAPSKSDAALVLHWAALQCQSVAKHI